jgi:hypothetical protein
MLPSHPAYMIQMVSSFKVFDANCVYILAFYLICFTTFISWNMRQVENSFK